MGDVATAAVVCAAGVVAWRQPWVAAMVGDWPAWLVVAAAFVSALLSSVYARRLGALHPSAVPLLVACSVGAAIAVTVA
ncbi:hypothetical protein AB0C27_40445 [Nonomuraea sp. NPDC048882]|uniref:hypothetical protein n=1 Tax=Nonomuraea sp. NPDC048882 TaxID=3154347 RepID=UPI0033E157CE